MKLSIEKQKNRLVFRKGEGELSAPIEPPHQVCEICNDDGGCLNNINHKDYEKNEQWDDPFGYMDCINYQEKKTNTQGQWIKGYIKKLQEKKKYEEENPYQSDFSKWNQSVMNSG